MPDLQPGTRIRDTEGVWIVLMRMRRRYIIMSLEHDPDYLISLNPTQITEKFCGKSNGYSPTC